MAQACDALSLAKLAPCDFCGIPAGLKLKVMVALLAQIAGVPVNAQTLAALAPCDFCGIPFNMKFKVIIALLCQIVNGGGSGPPPPVTCADADATAFLNTALITDSTISSAICTLVTSLKSAGVWALMDAIYPFVGGTSASTSYNLKNPAAFQITWHGGVTFNANGVTGNGTTGYGDTGFNPNTAGGNYALNSASFGFNVAGSPVATPIGANAVLNTAIAQISISVTQMQLLGPNVNSATNSNQDAKGFYLASRTAAAAGVYYFPAGNAAFSSTVTGVPTNSFYVLAFNNVGSPSDLCGSTLSFACIGSGLTGTQEAALAAAVLAFETILSRN